MELEEKLANMRLSFKGLLDNIEVEQYASVNITNDARLTENTGNLDEVEKQCVFDVQRADFGGELGQVG